MIVTILLAAAVIALDQLTKYWAQTGLQPVVDLPLWEGVFHFHYARNTGAAFSMLENQNWLFFLFTAAVVIAMSVYLVRHRRGMHPLLKVCLGLVMGGALGNLIDRVFLGYVVDFLYFKLIDFAIFNGADSALVVGCILLGVYILFIHDRYVAAQAGGETDGSDDGNGQPDL